MSPSPAVPLEVERYIGACLISNHNRQKLKAGDNNFVNRERCYQQQQQQQQSHRPGTRTVYHEQQQRCGEGWAGGMPLISFVNQNNRPRRPDQHQHQHAIRQTVPAGDDYKNLARLAVHTKGAPLILSKTYNHRKNKIQRNQHLPNGAVVYPKNKNGLCENSNNLNLTTVDTVSVTSDESYGSGNSSDQCLPRIIKPRKRRKKERKLPAATPFGQGIMNSSTDSQEFSSSCSETASPEIVVNPTRFLTFDTSPYNDNVNVFDFLLPERHETEVPELHHSFEDVEDLAWDESKVVPTTRCQCRYCDPSGQIWDVDKTSYSSFLTPPPDPCHILRDLSRLTIGVHPEPPEAPAEKGPAARNCDRTSDLEVSTEIVTSLNGHRDLEIKFFSTTSVDGGNSARTCNNKVFARNSIDIETC